MLLVAGCGSPPTTADRAETLSESLGLDYERDRQDGELSDQQFVNANADTVRSLREMDDEEASDMLAEIRDDLIADGADPIDADAAVRRLADVSGVQLSDG